jgi:outer membrane protein OmpA-like peptidoglycan-associated protein
MAASAQLLLDSAQAVADTEGLYGDAEFVGYAGNVDFFANSKFPRSMANLNSEIQEGFVPTGLVAGSATLAAAGWDYGALKRGLSATSEVESPHFDESQVAAVVNRRQQQNRMTEGQLFAFEIFFEPNQNGFSADLYRESFEKVIDLASTYGGALITIEGHSDTMAYLREKKAGQSELVLGRIRQSAKNLSLSRAIAVRDSLIEYAKGKGITLDESQFAVVGQGISQPRNGMCGADPCPPKDEREWRNNMRVQFRLIQVEAESSVFKPL